jgi:RNA polymerase sigma-70 factor (ECF subfamily)
MQIEIELLKACTENDRKAQKELYKCCFKIFMPQCLRYNLNEEDARFAFNNAFLKIILGLEKSNLKGLIFIPWAKKIVTNVLIDEYRKQKRQQEHYTNKETDHELEVLAENDVNGAEGSFGYDLIIKQLNEIPETHGLVFKLFVIEGYSHKEIAEKLNFNEGTSKWHLSIAKKLLRERLELLEQRATKKMVV